MSGPILAANLARPRRGTWTFLAVFVIAASTLASAQLAIAPDRLPDATVGVNYYLEFQASGGTPPYTWRLRGLLPQGVSFDEPTGTLTGIPARSGDFSFIIQLADRSRSVSRAYVLRVSSGSTINIIWTRPPVVANGGISGEVEVSNPGREAFDLTFIAVAVNEIGRATALGYQRFTLGAGKQRIPFGTTLPRGTYVVHADAVGEIARTLTIRRARLQSQPLVVP